MSRRRPTAERGETSMRIASLLTALLVPLAALADEVGQSGSHWFTGGGNVEITVPVAGNAYLVGEFISVKAPVAGSVYAAGSHVNVDSSIGKGLVAGAASIRVSGAVRQHARLYGETVELAPSASLEGPVTIGARAATIGGHVDGDLRLTAETARVNGTIGGDLDITAGSVELGPDARIAGHLRYRGDHAPVLADGAQVVGGVEQLSSHLRHFDWGDGPHWLHGFGHGFGFGTGFVVGLLMLLLGPAFMTDTSNLARREWAMSMGIGLLVLIAVPFGALLLAITLIGIPVALLALALYAALLMLGYACGAIAVGDFALQALAPARAAATGARVLALLGALLALALLRHVYLIGGFAVMLVFLCGVGALLQRAFRKAPQASAA
jgi:hypothetical protein